MEAGGVSSIQARTKKTGPLFASGPGSSERRVDYLITAAIALATMSMLLLLSAATQIRPLLTA